MSLRLFGLLVMDAVVGITAVGCSICLYRFTRRPKRSPAAVSALIMGMTALTTGLQFVFPEILTAFRRNSEALLAGEWWRMVTPLFVQSNGLRQCVGNGVAAIIFLPLAERLYGKRLWVLYFVPGVAGEVFAYAWGKDGAGSSLGIAGVMGSLFAFTFLYRRELAGPTYIAAMFGFTAAVVLCLCQGTHGPPVLMGVLLTSLLTMLWPNQGGCSEPTVPLGSRDTEVGSRSKNNE
jgi:rhomboid protease GluP